MQNLDKLGIELIKSMGEDDLSKGLPPKLKYRFYKWLKSLTPQQDVHRSRFAEAVKSEMIGRLTESLELSELKKNEFMASSYSDGSFKLDFGSDVPSAVKQAAMKWAKRKGLKPVEVGLAKSDGSGDFILVSAQGKVDSTRTCVARKKWALDLQ